MKKILLAPVLLTMMFCNTANTKKTNMTTAITSECPSDGKCSVQLLKNKGMDLKLDTTGKLYYQLVDANNTSVVIYEYNRNVEEGLQDGQHKEEVIFEIANETSELHLKDDQLQEVKMLFGRHCFCRGQAGFFAVGKGTLNASQKADQVTFDLDFKVDQVPQLYTKVKATVAK